MRKYLWSLEHNGSSIFNIKQFSNSLNVFCFNHIRILLSKMVVRCKAWKYLIQCLKALKVYTNCVIQLRHTMHNFGLEIFRINAFCSRNILHYSFVTLLSSLVHLQDFIETSLWAIWWEGAQPGSANYKVLVNYLVLLIDKN